CIRKMFRGIFRHRYTNRNIYS
ncbi:hypothetical protein ECFRIK1999_0998, partial [Escherichia coli FRIK1999]